MPSDFLIRESIARDVADLKLRITILEQGLAKLAEDIGKILTFYKLDKCNHLQVQDMPIPNSVQVWTTAEGTFRTSVHQCISCGKNVQYRQRI